MQPEERKPSSVRSSLLSTAMARASPVGVTPAMAGAAPSAGLDAGGVDGVDGGGDGAGARRGGVADAGAELVQGAQDVGMAAEEARHQDAEHQNHERRDNDQRDHAASFSAFVPVSIRAGAEARHRPPRRGRPSSGILRSVPADDLFLPEPEPREVRYTVISVDDHVVEPAHTFEDRLPAALADRAPASSRRRRGIRCGSSRASATRRWG